MDSVYQSDVSCIREKLQGMDGAPESGNRKNIIWAFRAYVSYPVGLLFFVQPLTVIFPKYAKWDPALYSFYVFTIGAVFAGLTTLLPMR